MAKKIFKFLLPVLTLLGLFIVLMVLSSAWDDDGCSCNKKDDHTVFISTNIIYFNKSGSPVSVVTRPLVFHDKAHVELDPLTGIYYNYISIPYDAQSYEFEKPTPIDLWVIDSNQGSHLVRLFVRREDCIQYPVIVVWDGTNLKAAI